jgi:hypothetical protein
MWPGKADMPRNAGAQFMTDRKLRTTVSVTQETKARLDRWRATGQCYDGFLSQLVTLWEKHKAAKE